MFTSIHVEVVRANEWEIESMIQPRPVIYFCDSQDYFWWPSTSLPSFSFAINSRTSTSNINPNR
jgi:hypothetical protein